MRLSGKALIIPAVCLALFSMPVRAWNDAGMTFLSETDDPVKTCMIKDKPASEDSLETEDVNHMVLLAQKPADSTLEPLFAYYFDEKGFFRSRVELMPDGKVGMVHYCDHDKWLGSLILNSEEGEPVSLSFADDNNSCVAADNVNIDEYRVWFKADPDVGEYFSRMMGFNVSALSNMAGLLFCQEGSPVYEVCFDDQGGLDHVRYGNSLTQEFVPEEEVTEEKGNKICRYFCRVSGDINTDTDDCQITRTRVYDLNGRLINYLYESSSGLPYDEPFISCTYDYNEDGVRTYKYRKTEYSEYEAFFDENGQLCVLHDIEYGTYNLYSYNEDGSLSRILMDTADTWSGIAGTMTAGEFIREAENSSHGEFPGILIAKYDHNAGTYTITDLSTGMISFHSIQPLPSDTIRPYLELDTYTYDGDTAAGKQVRRNIPDEAGFYIKTSVENVSYDENGNESAEETSEADLFSVTKSDDSYRIYENPEADLCYVLAEAQAPAGEAEFSPGKNVSGWETLNETVEHLAEVISD